jgi:uncharacterized protein (DUF58 family)
VPEAKAAPTSGRSLGWLTQLPRPTRSAALLLLLAVILELLGRLIGSTGVTVAAAAALGAVIGDAVLTPTVHGIGITHPIPDRMTAGIALRTQLTITTAGAGRRMRQSIIVTDRHPALPPSRVVSPLLRPGAAAVAVVVATPPRRGYWADARQLSFEACSPLGGFVRRGSTSRQVQTWVHPAPAPAFRLPDVVHGRAPGSSTSPRSGAGTEFFSLREWRSGDSASAIHWRASARRSHLVVMDREQPAHSSMLVIAGPAAVAGEGWERAIARAAATAVAAKRAGRAIRMLDGDHATTPTSPRDILDWFARLDLAATANRAAVQSALQTSGEGAVVLWLSAAPPSPEIVGVLRAAAVGALINCIDGVGMARR